jgi:hypothetical protein
MVLLATSTACAVELASLHKCALMLATNEFTQVKQRFVCNCSQCVHELLERLLELRTSFVTCSSCCTGIDSNIAMAQL